MYSCCVAFNRLIFERLSKIPESYQNGQQNLVADIPAKKIEMPADTKGNRQEQQDVTWDEQPVAQEETPGYANLVEEGNENTEEERRLKPEQNAAGSSSQETIALTEHLETDPGTEEEDMTAKHVDDSKKQAAAEDQEDQEASPGEEQERHDLTKIESVQSGYKDEEAADEVLERMETALQTFAQVKDEANYQMQEMQVMMDTFSDMDNIDFSAEELSKLAGKCDLLYVMAKEKQLSIDEEIERRDIFASTPHREFYVMLFNKLKCTIIACESLASGMVQRNEAPSYKAWLASLVKEKSIPAAMKSAPLGKLVRDSIKWALQQVPLPLFETLGTIFHALCTIKEERDKYIAAARVATFAVIADEMGGVNTIFARLSRFMVRSDCFVGKKKEFASWQRWASEMLLEPSTQSLAQASLVAEQVLNCIMKPNNGCPIQDILNGNDTETSLDVAIAAVVLDLPAEDVKRMVPFINEEISQQEGSSECAVSTVPQKISTTDQVCTIGGNIDEHNASSSKTTRLRQKSELTVSTSSVSSSLSDVASLEVLERLRLLEEDNRRLKHQLSQSSDRGKDDSKAGLELGGGLVQTYASHEEQYQGRLEILEEWAGAVDERLDTVSSEQASTREIAERAELAVFDIQAELQAVREGRTPRRRSQSGVLNRSRRKRISVSDKNTAGAKGDP